MFDGLFRSFWKKLLQSAAFLAFPSPVRVSLQRLKGVNIGRGVFLGTNVYLDDRNPDQIFVGEGSFITAGCIVLAHERDTSTYVVGSRIGDCPLRTAPVKIGSGVHVGMGSIILPGVTIGDGAIIGAGAVVSKNIPPYSLAVGIPAKVIRTFPDA